MRMIFISPLQDPAFSKSSAVSVNQKNITDCGWVWTALVVSFMEEWQEHGHVVDAPVQTPGIATRSYIPYFMSCMPTGATYLSSATHLQGLI